jgi:hypothetical protein
VARRRNSARSPRYLAAARVVHRCGCVLANSQLVGLRLMITTSNILGCVSPFKQYAFAIDQNETVSRLIQIDPLPRFLRADRPLRRRHS